MREAAAELWRPKRAKAPAILGVSAGVQTVFFQNSQQGSSSSVQLFFCIQGIVRQLQYVREAFRFGSFLVRGTARPP